MDNNFEQQFTQNVKSTMPQQPVAIKNDNSKLILIIAIALAAITLVESIALIITLTNFFSSGDDYDDTAVSDEYFVDEEDDSYGYDDDGNLSWLNITCKAEDGSQYTLSQAKTYEQRNSSSSIVGSGDYSIVDDDLISLTGASEEKVLYYNGFDLADGLKIYYCDEESSE